MRRRVHLLAATLLLLTSLLVMAVPAQAQDCTTHHAGDLTIGQDQIFEIRDCVFCQHGNVLVTGNGILRIQNADLVVEAPDSGACLVRLADSARLEMTHSRVVSSGSLEVTFDDSSSVLIDAGSELEWFHAHGAATIEVRDSSIGDFHLHAGTAAVISGSRVSVTLLVDGAGSHTLSNLVPGFISLWSLEEQEPSSNLGYAIELSETTVENWSVLSAADVEVWDAVLYKLEINGGSLCALENVTAFFLPTRGFGGTITWDHGSLLAGIACWDASFSLSGEFEAHAATIWAWQAGRVLRSYPVVLTNPVGEPIANADLVLYNKDAQAVWAGQTDAMGGATFSIAFDDSNFSDTWTLLAPALGASADVHLLSDTPVLFAFSGDIDGDGTISMLDVRLCLQIATGLLQGDPEQRDAADVDHDGDIDLDDAQALAEYVLGLTTSPPGGGS